LVSLFGGDVVATRLTKRTVDGLEPREVAYTEFDNEIPGFGCRVYPSGVKSFCLEYRPAGGGRGVNKKRLALGRYGALTAEQARRGALDALARKKAASGPPCPSLI